MKKRRARRMHIETKCTVCRAQFTSKVHATGYYRRTCSAECAAEARVKKWREVSGRDIKRRPEEQRRKPVPVVIDRPINKRSRSCLRCSKHFVSVGAGNRICPQCSIANSRENVKPEYRIIGTIDD